jgi:hypothetical protein
MAPTSGRLALLCFELYCRRKPDVPSLSHPTTRKTGASCGPRLRDSGLNYYAYPGTSPKLPLLEWSLASAVSLNPLVGEAVAAGPIRTVRTLLPVRIVDTLLMWATDDAICYHHRAHPMLFDETQDLRVDGGIEAHVVLYGKPAPQNIRFGTFAQKNGNSYLTRPLSSRPVQGYSGDGISLKSALRKLVQPRRSSLDFSHRPNEIPNRHVESSAADGCLRKDSRATSPFVILTNCACDLCCYVGPGVPNASEDAEAQPARLSSLKSPSMSSVNWRRCAKVCSRVRSGVFQMNRRSSHEPVSP